MSLVDLCKSLQTFLYDTIFSVLTVPLHFWPACHGFAGVISIVWSSFCLNGPRQVLLLPMKKKIVGIARCICFRLENVFVFDYKMYLSQIKLVFVLDGKWYLYQRRRIKDKKDKMREGSRCDVVKCICFRL